MPQAYRIVHWWKYELLKNGKLATAKTKMSSIRIKPLIYVRFPVHGHSLTADYRRMVRRAGELAAACDGVYKALVGLAGNQVREYRGWVLDDRQRPLNPGQLAELLCLSERKVNQIFEILLDREVKWIEFLDFPESLHKSLQGSGLSSQSQNKNFGNKREKKGSALNETEAEIKDKDNRFEANRIEGGGVREKGEVESQGAGEGEKENEQPQALPAALASVSDSGTDPVPVSVSEQSSGSGSDSAPVADSVSKPGPRAGPGAEGVGVVSKEKMAEIIREVREATIELSQIIRPHNSSDITTISDIYEQLQHLLVSGSPYPLLEFSLTTARQCWRAKKPIAMWVAAMKKPPFYYVPKKLSVVPGKFSTNRHKK